MIGNAVAYVVGCFLGMMLRAGMWFRTQPVGTGFRDWWRARLPANLISIAVAALGAGVWLDGTLIRWAGLGDKVAVTTAMSPIAGAVLTYGARWLVAAFDARVKQRLNVPGGDE